MSNLDKYFKGQQKNEEYICFFRKHWVVLLKEILYLSVFFLIVFLSLINIDTIQNTLQGNRELKILFFTVFLMGTVFLHRSFIKLLNYFVRIGIITNMRIIDHHKSLFFIDNKDSIDMAQIQNVERVKEGVLPNLLRYGDIRVFLNASSAVKTLQCVPNAKFHFRCINRQKEGRQRRMASNQPRSHQTPHSSQHSQFNFKPPTEMPIRHIPSSEQLSRQETSPS